jgi:hypothetical protein
MEEERRESSTWALLHLESGWRSLAVGGAAWAALGVWMVACWAVATV